MTNFNYQLPITLVNTDRLALDLIDFLAMIEKRSKRRLKKEIFTFVKNIVLTKNWFVVSDF